MLSFHVLEFLWASIQSQDCCNQDWNMLRIPLWNQSLCVASGRPPINPNPIIITHPAHQFLYLFSLKCPKQCLPNLPKRKHSPIQQQSIWNQSQGLSKDVLFIFWSCVLYGIYLLQFGSWYLSLSHLIWLKESCCLIVPPSSSPRVFGAIKLEGSSAKCLLSFSWLWWNLLPQDEDFARYSNFLAPHPSILILFYHHFYCSNLTLHIGSRKGMMMQLHRLDFSRLPKIEI